MIIPTKYSPHSLPCQTRNEPAARRVGRVGLNGNSEPGKKCGPHESRPDLWVKLVHAIFLERKGKLQEHPVDYIEEKRRFWSERGGRWEGELSLKCSRKF